MEQNESGFDLDDVIGPILYEKPMTIDLVEHAVHQVVEFIVPISLFKGLTAHGISSSLIGSNVYPSNTALMYIAMHQGVLSREDDEESFGYCANTYDKDGTLSEHYRRVAKMQNVAAIQLILAVVPPPGRYQGSTQYGVKSRASNKKDTCQFGLVFIFGQPLSEMPKDTMRMKMLQFTGLEKEIIRDERWLRFSLTGEPISSFRMRDFVDDGVKNSEWLTVKLAKKCVYFDTEADRYEFSMAQNGHSLKLSKLKKPAPTIGRMKQDGTPIRDANKETLAEDIVSCELVWDECGVTIRGERYGDFLGYLWVKRKRVVNL